ncbi:hypothetical protein K432DRAFT_267227, partial [Lepidopterella palustris CBS 459.81]
MLEKKTKLAASFIFVAAFLLCVVLSVQTFCKEENEIAGIATLSVRAPYLLFSSRSIALGPIPGGSDVHSLKGVVQSAGNVAITAISLVNSDIQNAVTSAMGAIETSIYTSTPKNYTLGTKSYCIGFSDRIDCRNLPLNITQTLPDTIKSSIRGQIPSLESLDQTLSYLTPGSIPGLSLLGAVLLLLLAALFFCSL